MKKILLLEDEKTLAEFYKKHLEAKNYKVTLAFTIEEAIKTIDSLSPDLAIIDHGIDGEEITGLDFIPILKDKHPETIVIMLSNYSHRELREDAANAGANDFLVKLNTSPRVLAQYVENLFT